MYFQHSCYFRKKLPSCAQVLEKSFLEKKHRRRKKNALCNSLQEALRIFDMEFKEKRGRLAGIAYSGGEDDLSDLIWPCLAPYIESGSEVVMEHDGDKEGIQFSDGDYHRIPVDEVDYEDEEDDEWDEEIEELLSRLKKFDVTPDELQAIIDKKGIETLVDDCGKTALLALFSYLPREPEKIREFGILPKLNELADVLINAGIDINQCDEDGNNPLFCALAGGFIDLAIKLMKHGAAIQVNEHYNPFDIVAITADLDLFHFLRENFREYKSHLPRCLVLLCAKNDSKITRDEIIKQIIEKECISVNASTHSELSICGYFHEKATPLMAAAHSESLNLIELLLSKGADKSLKDSKGNLALHYCSGQTWIDGNAETSWTAGKHNLSAIKLLVESCNFLEKNAEGQSPYMLAMDRNPNAIKFFDDLLKDQGVTPPLQNSSNVSGNFYSKIDSKRAYTINYKKCTLDGLQQFYFYGEEKPFVEIEYKNDVPHGYYKGWHESGGLMFSATFVEGNPVGEVNFYNEEGFAIKILNFDADGKLHGRQLIKKKPETIAVDANYKHGKPHGHIFFKNIQKNKVLIDETFENGSPETKKKPKKDDASKDLMSNLINSLLGVSAGSTIYLSMMEELLIISKNLIFHKHEKLKSFIEKTQIDRIHQSTGFFNDSGSES